MLVDGTIRPSLSDSSNSENGEKGNVRFRWATFGPVHIEKLPDDKGWRVHVSVRGRRRSVTRRTRAEALHAGAEITLEMGGVTATTQTTVGELVAGHLNEVEATWSPSYMTDARRVIDKLPDTFMRRPVRDITPAILDGLYRQLERDGWTAHRIKRAHTVLSVAFARAAVYGWCTHNPCRVARPPHVDTSNVRAPEHDQLRSILDNASEDFVTYLRVAACTGARRGEVVALKWSDIHFQAGEVTIARSIVTIRKKDGDGFVERPTKTGAKAHRRLPLDDTALTALRRRYAEQCDMADRAELPEPVWVFSHDAGVTPWRPDYISRLYRLARNDAGYTKGPSLNGVRHYVATTMLEDGESAIDVAHQLGHASVATTLSVYASYMPGRGRDSAERRADRLRHEK